MNSYLSFGDNEEDVSGMNDDMLVSGGHDGNEPFGITAAEEASFLYEHCSDHNLEDVTAGHGISEDFNTILGDLNFTKEEMDNLLNLVDDNAHDDDNDDTEKDDIVFGSGCGGASSSCDGSCWNSCAGTCSGSCMVKDY